MNKHHFFKNFFYVVLYGGFATMLNFIYIALMTIFISEAIKPHDFGLWSYLTNYSMIFYSACISSKDSTLVLLLLNFKKRPKLFSIMFGECITISYEVRDDQRFGSVFAAEGSEHPIEEK